jgi:hypothetical protein
MGADIMDPSDPAQVEWVKSCYYPSEIAENQRQMITKFDRLRNLDLGNLWNPRSMIDFTYRPDAGRIKQEARQLGVDTFDVVFFITVFSQLHENERVAMINHAKTMGRRIVIQDFATPNPKMPSGLEFYQTWQPWTYKTIEIDPEDGRPQELFVWDSGRCRSVIIAPSANVFASRVSE